MDHGEMNTEELPTALKLIPGYDNMMERGQLREEREAVEERMKEVIGEKKIKDLNLRELIELEKKLETLQPNSVENIRVQDMTEETKDIIIMKDFVKFKIGDLESKIFKPQDKFDIIMEAFEENEGRVKMRIKVFIGEKEREDIDSEELIVFSKRVQALQPKSIKKMHFEDMSEEVKDIIIMNEIVKKMISKRPSSSQPEFIPIIISRTLLAHKLSITDHI